MRLMYRFAMRKVIRVAMAFGFSCVVVLVPAASFGATFGSVSHIHDVKVFGKEILMPTHEGLYQYQGANSMQIVAGPVFDVMGLASYGKTLYASGHPGDRPEFPNPIGLISSTDGGKSWKKISLQGKVDFHMLEVGKFDIYGGDSTTGQLMHSANQGKSWKKLEAGTYSDIAPLNSKRGGAYGLLAGALVRTADGFVTTVALKSSLKWSSVEVVGTTIYATSGKSIYQSTDGAKSWKKIATLPSEISSISGNAKIIAAVTQEAIFISRDGGKSFNS